MNEIVCFDRLDSVISDRDYQVLVLGVPSMKSFDICWKSFFIVKSRNYIAKFEFDNKEKPIPSLGGLSYVHKTDLSLCSENFKSEDDLLTRRTPCRILANFSSDEKYYGVWFLADKIIKSPNTYPYRQNVGYFTPNCNTYVQYYLSRASLGLNFDLPWNYFGKNMGRKNLVN